MTDILNQIIALALTGRHIIFSVHTFPRALPWANIRCPWRGV